MAEKVEVHNISQVNVLKKKNKKRRLKRKVKITFVVVLIVGLLGYIASPFSKVQSVELVGENYLNEKEIKKASGITTSDFALFVFPNVVEKKLLKEPFVASCKVEKKFFHKVVITVTEQKVIGYIDNGKGLRIVDESGKIANINYDQLSTVQNRVSIQNFTDEKILETFALQLSKVPSSTLSLISEAIFSPVKPYDKERIQLNMTDGKKVFVRLDDMASELKYYQEILSRQPNACVYDIYGNKVYATGCE